MGCVVFAAIACGADDWRARPRCGTGRQDKSAVSGAGCAASLRSARRYQDLLFQPPHPPHPPHPPLKPRIKRCQRLLGRPTSPSSQEKRMPTGANEARPRGSQPCSRSRACLRRDRCDPTAGDTAQPNKLLPAGKLINRYPCFPQREARRGSVESPRARRL